MRSEYVIFSGVRDVVGQRIETEPVAAWRSYRAFVRFLQQENSVERHEQLPGRCQPGARRRHHGDRPRRPVARLPALLRGRSASAEEEKENPCVSGGGGLGLIDGIL